MTSMRRVLIASVAAYGGLMVGDVPMRASSAQPQQPTSPQAGPEAPPRVSTRVAPTRNAGDNRRVLDTFELYLEPTIKSFAEPQTLSALSVSVCGHRNDEWIKRVRERNKLRGDVVQAGAEVTLAPCPYGTFGGAITVHEYENFNDALGREVGDYKADTVTRIAEMNKTTVRGLEEAAGTRTWNVDFRTAPVSHIVKPQFRAALPKVVSALNAVPGALRASSEIELSLVGGDEPDCDAVAPDNNYPFDSDAVAAVLEFNLSLRTPRMAIVGVIDTGIDELEGRLFISKNPVDGSVGANLDRNGGRFPTNAATYQDRGHGTHVAGLVLGGLHSPRLAALVRNRIALKIFNIVSQSVRPGPNGLVEDFAIPLTNLEAAITQTQSNPQIPILNLSIETDIRHPPMRDLFADGDYLAIVAAGNAGRDIGLLQSYPASWRAQLPHRFLSVAAVLPDNTLAPFSNHGIESVDLAAPGCRVSSLLPAAPAGQTTGTMTGTSQAAPLVTFAAALLYSEWLTPQEIRNRIRASVRLVAPLQSRLGAGGVLDIATAISIHEDLVTIRGETTARRGTIDTSGCLDLLEDCWQAPRVARLVAPESNAAGMARVWLYADDGDIVTRLTRMPVGTLRFKPRGAVEHEEISFADVAEIMFALRPR